MPYQILASTSVTGTLNMNGYEILNFRVQNLGVLPSGSTGQLVTYDNGTTQSIRAYYNGQWNELASVSYNPATISTLGAVKMSVAPVDANNPIAVGDNDSRMTNARPPTGAAGGDLNGNFPSPGVASVGGATAAAIADAATKRHTQNTDTGTTATSFQVDSGNTGPRIKNFAGTLQLRNSADNAFADAQLKNLTVEGDLTVNGTNFIVNSNTVTIGDSQMLLNADVTNIAQNSDGGIAVHRVDGSGNSKDAVLNYSTTNEQWEATFGAVTGTLVTAKMAVVVTATIGNGVATSFNITHNLNTLNVLVGVREAAAPYNEAQAAISRASANVVTVAFTTAPSSNSYVVTIMG